MPELWWRHLLEFIVTGNRFFGAIRKACILPAAVGFAVGVGFLLLLDEITPHMHFNNDEEGVESKLKRTTKLILAVTLHNIPEGMAVGVVYAGWMAGSAGVSRAAALTLALGIAIQNFPEGAVVSMPLRAEGMSKWKTFIYGVLSGIVEPIASIFTILAASMVVPVLPYFWLLQLGAMMYVVVEELIPEMSEGEHSNKGTISFLCRFYIDDDFRCCSWVKNIPYFEKVSGKDGN